MAEMGAQLDDWEDELSHRTAATNAETNMAAQCCTTATARQHAPRTDTDIQREPLTAGDRQQTSHGGQTPPDAAVSEEPANATQHLEGEGEADRVMQDKTGRSTRAHRAPDRYGNWDISQGQRYTRR